jgi:hypothetical protein
MKDCASSGVFPDFSLKLTLAVGQAEPSQAKERKKRNREISYY